MTNGQGNGASGGAGDQQPTLTTRQGHPAYDNQHSRTVGDRGPTTLENYHFLEKISHFDRERIPERVVHARGAGAHGYFEAYGTVGGEPIAKFTRAKLFQKQGQRTPLFTRFSTVIGGRDSAETARDPRGFAVKFYTEDGNWDLVGNNLPVFFIRDAIKFPDVIHSLKPSPDTFRQEPNRIFDFMSQTPEAMHMLTWLFSPRGIPASYRHQDGFGVNTYKWVNMQGEAVLVKYHWKTKQGITSLTEEQAATIQATDTGHATKDLHAAIERGEYPEWELCVQIMSDDEHPELDFDPLDDTKTWPEDQFPLRPVGKMVLDRWPDSFFAETEQVSFGTGVLVDGLDFSDDKMLQGRTFSYSDTQRYRVGPNYLQLPINQPKTHVATNQRDGQMTYVLDQTGPNPKVNYEPNSTGGLVQPEMAGKPHEPYVEGRVMRKKLARTNDYQQAGLRYRTIEAWERDDLVKNLVSNLSECQKHIQEKMVWHFTQCDEEFGRRISEGLKAGQNGATPQTPEMAGAAATNQPLH
ncbi:MAG: catalase [Chloroflexota bacterium]|nr:catalase [Chloroflexota bacterium]